MFRTARSALMVALFSGLVAACASTPPSESLIPQSTAITPYKIGRPYQIGENWYYPREQPEYDEVGVASWYGPTFYGKHTASGEIYDGQGLTAAHRTLPLPVNVRVTNLDNGKSLVVRVNDRGPFAKGRIIDVSKHAAELLGFYAKGTARVRVTYLGRANGPTEPTDDPDTALAQAFRRAAPARVESASMRTATVGTPRPVQVASLDPPPLAETSEQPGPPLPAGSSTDRLPAQTAPHLYIQAGTFSSEANAERLQARLADAGAFVSPTERNGRALYRVRSGPYDDLESANAALAKLAELGNNGAQIVVDR